MCILISLRHIVMSSVKDFRLWHELRQTTFFPTVESDESPIWVEGILLLHDGCQSSVRLVGICDEVARYRYSYAEDNRLYFVLYTRISLMMNSIIKSVEFNV